MACLQGSGDHADADTDDPVRVVEAARVEGDGTEVGRLGVDVDDVVILEGVWILAAGTVSLNDQAEDLLAELLGVATEGQLDSVLRITLQVVVERAELSRLDVRSVVLEAPVDVQFELHETLRAFVVDVGRAVLDPRGLVDDTELGTDGWVAHDVLGLGRKLQVLVDGGHRVVFRGEADVLGADIVAAASTEHEQPEHDQQAANELVHCSLFSLI